MLTLLKFQASDKNSYDVFLNRDGNVCCLEHDFGSPMIQNASIEQACDWLIERGISGSKEEISSLLKKLSKSQD